MDTREYTPEALRTWKSSGDWTKDMMYLSSKLTYEAGEAGQLVAKWSQHGKNYTQEQIRDELGDVLWYLTVLAHENGLHLETLMEHNIEKLRERHPTGDVKEFYGDKNMESGSSNS